MRVVSALEVRGKLGAILDDVSQYGLHYVVERLNKPLVVVVPYSQYQEYVRVTKNMTPDVDMGKQLVSSILRFRRKYGKKFAKGKSVVDLIREDRDGR